MKPKAVFLKKNHWKHTENKKTKTPKTGKDKKRIKSEKAQVTNIGNELGLSHKICGIIKT